MLFIWCSFHREAVCLTCVTGAPVCVRVVDLSLQVEQVCHSYSCYYLTVLVIPDKLLSQLLKGLVYLMVHCRAESANQVLGQLIIKVIYQTSAGCSVMKIRASCSRVHCGGCDR